VSRYDHHAPEPILIGRPLSGNLLSMHRLRLRAGLSQHTLAEMMGVCRSTIRSWERCDSHPPYRVIPSLAEALRVAPDALYFKIETS
jgi:transcriptional regulator with XRE-family HTH domain